jgi:hypothetical protein
MFRGVPQSMPTIDSPFIAAGLAHLVFVFVEQILPANKSKPHNPGANIRRRDKFHLAVAKLNAIGPSRIRDFLHF